jgi:hypothetical protein
MIFANERLRRHSANKVKLRLNANDALSQPPAKPCRLDQPASFAAPIERSRAVRIQAA